MPDDSKKRRNDPKEQRRPRQRHQAKTEARKDTDAKIDTRVVEESKSAPKVIVPQKPPVYEDPGPEFYKNLKRETDEILKITEEENTKYKKKEIQSNWTKYEMPIESYDEIEEQENMGEDYEKLIQAPLSIGGHFQFKHEKSWDVNTGPSLYDKHFEINMDDLSLALSTIPFHERNNIDQSIFHQTDIVNMNNRSTRFKQKYFNDKSFTTPELESQDKILNSLREGLGKSENKTNADKNDFLDIHFDGKIQESIEEKRHMDMNNDLDINLDANIQETVEEKKSQTNNDNLDFNFDAKIEQESVGEKKFEVKNLPIVLDTKIKESVDKIEIETKNVNNSEINPSPVEVVKEIPVTNINPIETLQEDKVVLINKKEMTQLENKTIVKPEPSVKDESIVRIVEPTLRVDYKESTEKLSTSEPVTVMKGAVTNPVKQPLEAKKNPIIESPEDLEKWLDDFLDG